MICKETGKVPVACRQIDLIAFVLMRSGTNKSQQTVRVARVQPQQKKKAIRELRRPFARQQAGNRERRLCSRRYRAEQPRSGGSERGKTEGKGCPRSYHVVLVKTKKDKYYHKTMAE